MLDKGTGSEKFRRTIDEDWRGFERKPRTKIDK